MSTLATPHVRSPVTAIGYFDPGRAWPEGWELRAFPFVTTLRNGCAPIPSHRRGFRTSRAANTILKLPFAACVATATAIANHRDERVVLALAYRVNPMMSSDFGRATVDELDTIWSAVTARAITDAKRDGVLWTALLDQLTELMSEAPMLEAYGCAVEAVVARWASVASPANVARLCRFETSWIVRAALAETPIGVALARGILRASAEPFTHLVPEALGADVRRAVRAWLYGWLSGRRRGALTSVGEDSVLPFFDGCVVSGLEADPLIAELETLALQMRLGERRNTPRAYRREQLWNVLSCRAELDHRQATSVLEAGRTLDLNGDSISVDRLFRSRHISGRWVAETALGLRGTRRDAALIASSFHAEARREKSLRNQLRRSDSRLVRLNLLHEADDEEWRGHAQWLLLRSPILALHVIDMNIDRASRLLDPAELTPLLTDPNHARRLRAFDILARWRCP